MPLPSTACSTGWMKSASRCDMRKRSAPSRRTAKRSFPGISENCAEMKIAVLPGDGIGPEIMAQARLVLSKLEIPLEMQEAPVGGAAYAAHGDPLPAKTLQVAKDA